jgi:hypothetical protein
MFRLPKSHLQASYIQSKYYILACVHIMESHIAVIDTTIQYFGS